MSVIRAYKSRTGIEQSWFLADEAVADEAVITNAFVVVLRENCVFRDAFCFFIAIVIFTRI